MSYRLLLAASFLQTLMFVVLLLYNSRMEERLASRLAEVKVVLSDVKFHNCEIK